MIKKFEPLFILLTIILTIILISVYISNSVAENKNKIYIHHESMSRKEIKQYERKRRQKYEVKNWLIENDKMIINSISNVKITSYSNDDGSINVPAWRDGLTATGVKAVKGIIAADWNIYPVGTEFYIPGYGIGVVQDRGSAIKGHHIDVFLPTRDQALEWGVKRKNVYIIK